MATGSKKAKKAGFVLQCPICGENDVTITLDLADLATCKCESCDDSWAAETAVSILTARLAQWTKVVEWIRLASDVIGEADDPAE